MTEEERTKKLNNERAKAVRQAKKTERELILEGKGTRDWTPEQQREWIRTGKCKGFKGHHMLNVNDHPEYAGDKNNIQFLTKEEHLAAHKGDYHNSTDGYYDPKTGKTKSFGDKPPKQPKPIELSNPLSERSVKINDTKLKNEKHEKYEEQKAKAAEQKAKAHSRAEELRAKSKAEGRAKTSGKTESAEKNRTDSKTLNRERTVPKSSESVSAKSQSKTLNRERSSSPKSGSSSPAQNEGQKQGHSRKH